MSGGTTSACAENTLGYDLRGTAHVNYLRVRGEYPWRKNAPCSTSELPPRARRILNSMQAIQAYQGTTSACAENTVYDEAYNLTDGNYLRVRGEYPK